MTRIGFTLLAAVWLCACTSAPPPARPLADEQAVRLNQRGEDAYRRGQWREALAAYDAALRIYLTIEHGDGIGMELLNTATVHYELGDWAAAIAALDRVLNDTSIPAPHRAEAAYRRAYMDFEAGDLGVAAVALDRAQALCPAGDCAAAGRLHNLKARLALARGEFTLAESEARRGLELNRRQATVTEEANSLRLLADTAARRRDPAQALALYQQALSLDKMTAQTHKIVLDLLGAARAAAALGRNDAAEFLERARRVAEGAGDAALTRQVEVLRQDLGR